MQGREGRKKKKRERRKRVRFDASRKKTKEERRTNPEVVNTVDTFRSLKGQCCRYSEEAKQKRLTY